ncbi:MAG: hypothetical protein MUO29_10980, partial [Desulfobacterales bacterium]|nr:hypothetical protein [Desulfobacterales bacterium]
VPDVSSITEFDPKQNFGRQAGRDCSGVKTALASHTLLASYKLTRHRRAVDSRGHPRLKGRKLRGINAQD